VGLDPRRVFDDNESLWWRGAGEEPPHAPLAGPRRADVAVIGAGFTGISTAYHLAKRFPELGVVVLEAKRVANGASGRNGGLVLTGVNGAHGGPPDVAKRIYDATSEGIDLVEGLIREHAIETRFRRDGVLEAFTSEARAEAAAKDVEAQRAAGLPLSFLSGAALRARLDARGVVGAVLDPNAGQLDGVRYLRGLARVTAGLGVAIHEGTPVVRVTEGPEILLETPRGDVRARAIVLATNAYTPALGYFRGGLFPLQSHLVGTAPLGADAWRAAGLAPDVAGFSDDLDRLAYGSMTPQGELVFGGGSNAAYTYRFGGGTRALADRRSNFAAVERRLEAYFPRLGAAGVRVAHRWSGPVALTLSRMCTMGVMGEHANVYFALGYSGHGVTLANLAGRVLADVYAGDDARWRDLPFYRHRLLTMPPEPLRFVGYHAYTALTGRSPRRDLPFSH
jgi:glycine/D-amino acid oxidase-like deaminating enzyme